MIFPCLDVVGCDCQSHVSWITHVAACRSCGSPLRKRTPGGPIVDSGDSTGWCDRCDTTWDLPQPYPNVERNWCWEPRAFYDYTDLLPLGEASELAAASQAEPPETAPMEPR